MPKARATSDVLVNAEIRELLDAIERRPIGGQSYSWDADEGIMHVKGGAYGNAERESLGYRLSDVKAFRRLLARQRGWPGHRLHVATWDPNANKGRGKMADCRCRSCAPIVASLNRFATIDEAEAVLAEALGTQDERPWYKPAAGHERGRVHRAKRNELGQCYRCHRQAAPGKSVCDECNEAAKERVRAGRARKKSLSVAGKKDAA